MTDDEARLAITTRDYVTAAVDLAWSSASRQAGHTNFDALISGILVSLVKLMAQMGPEHMATLEDYCGRIGPVIFADVRMVMAAEAEQNPTRPLSVATMQ